MSRILQFIIDSIRFQCKARCEFVSSFVSELHLIKTKWMIQSIFIIFGGSWNVCKILGFFIRDFDKFWKTIGYILFLAIFMINLYNFFTFWAFLKCFKTILANLFFLSWRCWDFEIFRFFYYVIIFRFCAWNLTLFKIFFFLFVTFRAL